MGIKNTFAPCSALCNNSHIHTLTLCSQSIQMFSFDCFPSQPSKLSVQDSSSVGYVTLGSNACLAAGWGALCESVQQCLPGKGQGCLSWEDLKDNKAPATLTCQEIVLRAKFPKGCLLPKRMCSPGCDLTNLTLDFDISLLCIWPPVTGNREKQAPLHSSHWPDTYLWWEDDIHCSPLTTKRIPAGSSQCFV